MSIWDERFMRLAEHVASWSKDRSRQIGCVIVSELNVVRSIGYNGFPRGLKDDDDARHDRPAKYLWTEHAERNAIYLAAREGIALAGCRMYLPWFPCIDCARAMLQVGLSELICFEPDLSDERWGEAFKTSAEILREGKLPIRYVST